MKKFIASIVAAALCLAAVITPHAGAANFQLTWTDTNTPAYQVTGYNLYMAVNTNAFQNAASVTNTGGTLAVTVTNLSPNLYKFYVTATNVWGESTPSMTVSTPPGLPSSAGVQLWFNLK